MTLELTIEGAGDAVVFLHGTPTAADIFAPIAHALAKTHTTIQVAMPGYGASARLAKPWSMSDLHAVIEAALRERSVGRVAIVGMSGGAYHALSLATRRALDVRAVGCLAGMTGLDAAERDAFRGFAAALRAGVKLPPMGDRFLSPRYRELHPEALDAVNAWFAATSAENLADELHAFVDAPDLAREVATLDIPIVARVGSLDVAAPRAKSEQIVAAAKHGTLEIVEGAGHALTLEDREATIASIRRMLERAPH